MNLFKLKIPQKLPTRVIFSFIRLCTCQLILLIPGNFHCVLGEHHNMKMIHSTTIIIVIFVEIKSVHDKKNCACGEK